MNEQLEQIENSLSDIESLLFQAKRHGLGMAIVLIEQAERKAHEAWAKVKEWKS